MKTTPANLTEHEVQQAAFDRLGKRFFLAAEVCAARKYGEARNGKGIHAVATEYIVRPIELLALFGFLPLHGAASGQYVDVLQSDNEVDIGVLPKGDERTALAYALCRAVSNDRGLSLVCE